MFVLIDTRVGLNLGNWYYHQSAMYCYSNLVLKFSYLKNIYYVDFSTSVGFMEEIKENR